MLSDTDLENHQKAYDSALAAQLCGQALLRQAFAILFNMPADRLIIRHGMIREAQFKQGQYIQLTQAGRPVIQPLPQSDNLDIPMVTEFKDIKPAFEALETSLQLKENNLHEHAIYLSTKELIEEYKKNPEQSISKLLSQLSYRFSKTGYTGNPFSPANALCAQLAWLAVDKTKRNPQEQFWKLLYPEVTGTYGVMADSHWPTYGEAILDENLANGKPGELINYRQFYSQALNENQRFQEFMLDATKDRVKYFHSGHHGFWFSTEAITESKQFNNYFEFFMAFLDLTVQYSKRKTGNSFETKIMDSGNDEFYRDYFTGLQRYLSWHENQDYVNKKMAESIICPAGKTGLIEIIRKINSKNSNERCLDANSTLLESLFNNNQDIKNYLKSIPYALLISQETMIGYDDLQYHHSHCRFINELDCEGLLQEVTHHKNVPMEAIALRFFELSLTTKLSPRLHHGFHSQFLIFTRETRTKAEDLLNFLGRINDHIKEREILNHLFKNPLFEPSLMGAYNTSQYVYPIKGYQYILKIYERLSYPEKKAELLSTILRLIKCSGIEIEDEENPQQFVSGLIYAAGKDTTTLTILRKIQAALLGFDNMTTERQIQASLLRIDNSTTVPYINSCRNDQVEISRVLDHIKNEKIYHNELDFPADILKDTSEVKRIFVFNYFKQEIIDSIKTSGNFKSYVRLFPELKDELDAAVNNNLIKIPGLTQSSTATANPVLLSQNVAGTAHMNPFVFVHGHLVRAHLAPGADTSDDAIYRSYDLN